MTGIRQDSHRQGGAVTLAVTAALLLLISAATLYANRSFVVEARTATNQTRHAQAFEAAQAGVEHMLARLAYNNATPIASTTLSAGNGQSYLVSVATRASGAILIDSLGCGDGCGSCSAACPVKARITQLAAWVPVLSNPPTAAVTARQTVRMTGNAEFYNTDPRWGGTAVRAGGAITNDGSAKTYTVAGSPSAAGAIQNDPTLAAMQPTDMFLSTFGMDRETLRAQAQVITATGPACGSALAGRTLEILWVEGDCVINSTDVVGSATAPVLLIVTGSLRIVGAGRVYGMVYNGATDADNADINSAGRGSIVGAAITEGSASVAGKMDMIYDRSLLTTLQAKLGSYARTPGGWKDFQ